MCDVSTSAEVCHDALVDLAREETFEAPDDLTFGAAVGRTSHNVVDRWLVVPHADDDRPIEGGVGLAVTAPVEAVPPSGPPGRGGSLVWSNPNPLSVTRTARPASESPMRSMDGVTCA